jgi:hypothetical protein
MRLRETITTFGRVTSKTPSARRALASSILTPTGSNMQWLLILIPIDMPFEYGPPQPSPWQQRTPPEVPG